jgi:hypothetical protein
MFVYFSVVMLFVFLAVNNVSAEETASQTTIVTESVVAPCDCGIPHFDPCHPPVVYRRGLFGGYRPVIYAPAPVYTPVYYPVYPRYVRAWHPVYPFYHW